MKYSIIDTLIERSVIRPGDSVWIETKVLGLQDHYILYLGKDEDDKQWMVARFENGVRVLSLDQMIYLIETTKNARINKFQGAEELRTKAVDRMMERLDTPTFMLILRNSEEHQKAVARSNSAFKWGDIALGVGILSLFGLGLKHWMDKKGE